jgi:ABC-type lipoprotein export system ATPase subunit
MIDNTLIHACDLTKVYRTGDVEVHALRGVTLDVAAGEFLAIVGPSGSGKTTLLNLAGALDSVTSGDLTVLGHNMADMGRRARADLRMRSLGFVFQAYNLVPVLTARENVAPGRRRCSTSSASASSRTGGRSRCRAASSSASPWRAPLPRAPSSCSPTSRRRTSTVRTPRSS